MERVSGRKIFITGGAGFIGGWACKHLLANNKIIVYDNVRHRNTLDDWGLSGNKNLKFINGDILDAKKLKNSIGDCDSVIHMAAIAGVNSYYRMPRKTMEVNMIGTYTVLESVKENKRIKTFIDFSTSEIYGGHIFRAREDGESMQGDIKDRRWTYAISKLAAEKFSHCYYWEYGLPVCSVRPFNIYGPNQPGEGAIQVLLSKVLSNKPAPITGDGNQIRAWCYVEDFVDGLLKCFNKKEAAGNAFNIGNPNCTITILGLVQKMIELTGSKSKIFYDKHIGVDVDLRVPDISKARQMLGYSPKIGLNEGLLRTIKWYKEHR